MLGKLYNYKKNLYNLHKPPLLLDLLIVLYRYQLHKRCAKNGNRTVKLNNSLKIVYFKKLIFNVLYQYQPTNINILRFLINLLKCIKIRTNFDNNAKHGKYCLQCRIYYRRTFQHPLAVKS